MTLSTLLEKRPLLLLNHGKNFEKSEVFSQTALIKLVILDVAVARLYQFNIIYQSVSEIIKAAFQTMAGAAVLEKFTLLYFLSNIVL